MRDRSKTEIEGSRPNVSVEEAVNFCYRALLRDTEHGVEDELVDGLTYEELLGALLLCKDKFDSKKI